MFHQLVKKINEENFEDTHSGPIAITGTQCPTEEIETIDELSEPVAVARLPEVMESLLITHEDKAITKFDVDRNLASEEYENNGGVHGCDVDKEEAGEAVCGDYRHTPEHVVHEDQITKAIEDPIKVAHVLPQSRLVRPPDRVIHTSPQKQANRLQSAIRPSSVMPNSLTPLSAVRSVRPPAPRSLARATEKESTPRKPTSRTQSQPRPTREAKTISQHVTPKVYRKVVTVSSKIGSFTDHKPQGGNVQIFSENRIYNVQSKIGSLDNVCHTPGGGNVKIMSTKLDFKDKATPKIDAKSDYVPPVPEKKAISQKLNWAAQSKIGSLDNVKHKPAGGNVQILDQKLEWHATSKVGSRGNIKHKPGGGNVQVICDCD